MKEAILQRQIQAAIKARGGKVQKIHGDQYTPAGSPDLIGSLDGRSFAIECKVGSNKPTPKQQHELSAWAAQGWATGVATSVDEALQIITREAE